MRIQRDMLLRLGIQRAIPFSSLVGVEEQIARMPADLILADIDSPDSESLKYIRAMRQDPRHPNPFAAVIATTWQPTAALVQRVTASGADALLVKPASTQQLTDRVVSLIENRRKFVVTSDYVGPDRRKEPRAGAPVPQFDAPNCLRLKVMGQWGRVNVRELMSQATGWVSEQKLGRTAVQVAFLVHFALEGAQLDPPDAFALDHLSRVLPLAESLELHTGARPNGPEISMVCRSLGELIRQTLERREALLDTQARDFAACSLTLMGLLLPDRTTESLQEEVSEAVASYRLRLQKMAATRAGTA